MSYTKLFNSIITSTIWTEDDKTRILWITMLALADKNGEVQASIPGLARVAGMSIPDCEAAIGKFLGPDPYSRTPDDEGRRIEAIPGGWALLNHGKYREMASRDESIAANAERQKRHRQKLKRNAPVTHSNALVTPRNASVTDNPHIAEAEAEADPLKEDIPPFALEIPKAEKPNPEKARVGKLLGRRESTQWSADEMKAYKAITPIDEDDLNLMEYFYGAVIEKDDYRRTAMLTLLRHWTGELDKARAFKNTKR